VSGNRLDITWHTYVFPSPETDCLCESAQFIADASACLKAHCSDDDITAAVYLQVAMCGGGQTVTGTVTTTHSVPFSLPSTSSGASASRSSPSAYVAGSTSTAPATYTSAPAATSSRAAASSFQALGGAGAAIGALLAGVLAL